MTYFHFTYDPNVSLEQRLSFEFAASIWSQVLLDDVTVNLHIVSTDNLNNGQAVGGAIPLFHEQNYGIYQEYVQQDATSVEDTTVISSQQDGNTVDVLIGDEVVDGNNTIMLTSAQAKALGMDQGLQLANGTHWNRDLVDPNALDGYILINNSFDWSYDMTHQNEMPENTLDFRTMALHEIGHALGFVSGLDGLLEVVELYSGETQAQGFTPLDLLRYTDASQALNNPDGQVADLTVGADANFSLDGETSLATFSTGQDTTVGGDGYQASHWERSQDALGIMDPTLGYQERTDISHLDLQAFDVLGWDINYDILTQGLDLQTLYNQSLQAVAADFGIDAQSLETAIDHGENSYTLGYSRWWQDFADHMVALGYSRWWTEFEATTLELGYSRWWQALEQPMQELGYSRWWQAFEDLVLELGYSRWWQEFETDMLELGYSRWWQSLEEPLLELGYSRWWQTVDSGLTTLETVDGSATQENAQVAVGGTSNGNNQIFSSGTEDDIIAGDTKQDRIKGGAGDDLIDGKEGDDVLWGEEGRDLIYGNQGNDLIYGGNDNDWLLGEAGEDDLHGQTGDDILNGGESHDILRGGDGRDDLKGGTGHDVLSGDAGNDRLAGEANNDIVIGGEGRDQVEGNRGDDLLYGDTYRGEETLNQLRALLKNENDSGIGQLSVHFSGPEGVENLSVGYYDETDGESPVIETLPIPQTDNNDVIQGGLGDDIAFGGEGNDGIYDESEQNVSNDTGHDDDVLIGGAGNDTLLGGLGNDTLNGTDAIAVGVFEKDTLIGGGGRDRFILGNSAQAFYSVTENSDYALIKDFNFVDDEIQLHGMASNYSQHQQDGNTLLYYQNETSDLVAVFENLSTKLDLNAAAHFV